jgi:Protein of unknown function (DUF3179)
MPETQEIQAVRSQTTYSLALASVFAAISAACLAIPIFVIRPFRPQGARELTIALAVRHAGPWISGFCAVAVLLALLRTWNRTRIAARVAMAALLLVAFAGAILTHVNIFEKMFHPYDSPSFESAAEAPVDADDKVLAVKVGNEARAYPIRTMGYHHIVNDTVGGIPIAVTYCTLCHTGLVWSRIVEGKLLHFRLAGINNGNALLRDEQTNSIWQQSTGEAIFGPLKGQQLKLVRSDELSFALWKSEQPNGQVLKSDPLYAAEYDPKDWEKHVARTPTVVDTNKSGIGPHELMLGIVVAGQSKAYPIEAILRTKLIQDQVADLPLLVVVGPDGTSIRVFEGKIENEPLTFATGTADHEMNDVETGSVWNFQGCAVAGKLAGRCLVQIDAHKDYWFDWMNHHPESAVFRG